MVSDLDLCELQCYQEPNCVSVNFKVMPDNKGFHECELNNASHERHDSDLKDKYGYVYKGAEVGILCLPLTLVISTAPIQIHTPLYADSTQALVRVMLVNEFVYV